MFCRGGQFILCPFSHFEMQDFRNPKKFLSAVPSLSLLIFSDLRHAGVQIHIDFNTESKSILFFKDQFLFTPQWSFKTNKTHETAFFCIHLVDLEGPSNHPVSKARAFCVM